MVSNDSIFMRALHKKPVPRTPVWLMRQAGRYLPEYRKVRAQAGNFLNLCRNKELACEVALQPLRRFPLDAAILFSDILTIPDAMGLGLYFAEGEGPGFKYPLHTLASIEALPLPPMKQALDYVMDAVTLIRQEIPADIPLIGFSGSPWTLACYMVEGKGSKQFNRLMTLITENPTVAHVLLAKLAAAVTDYLFEQVHAGADVLMIFDTWGGLLTTPNYQTFSLAYMQTIVANLAKRCPNTPIILFTKGSSQWLSLMANTGCHALGLDWTCDINKARQEVGDKVALQGNFEPALLLADDETIRHQVKTILAAYGQGSGHIFNLGHGITPDVAPEKVKLLIDTLHELSPYYHQE